MSPLSCTPIDSRHYERLMVSLLASQTVDIADCHTSDVHDNQDPTLSPPCPAYWIVDTNVTTFRVVVTQIRPQ